jgi:hypothetical protein
MGDLERRSENRCPGHAAGPETYDGEYGDGAGSPARAWRPPLPELAGQESAGGRSCAAVESFGWGAGPRRTSGRAQVGTPRRGSNQSCSTQ